MRYRNAILSLAIALLLMGGTVGCADDVTDVYSRYPAFFRFTTVSAVIPLYNATQSPGMFCSITIGTSTYQFTGNDGQTMTYPISAAAGYGRPECISGFVVGKASVPDLDMQYPLVAYDLACPACNEIDNITRALSYSDREVLTCRRCKRSYSLTQNGVAISGEGSYRLYRYHVSYAEGSNTLLISN